MSARQRLSLVIPVLSNRDDIVSTHKAYVDSLEPSGLELEPIYVIDGDKPAAMSALRQLRDSEYRPIILHLAQADGEASALSVGFRHATGDLVMTLPDHPQVIGAELLKLLESIEDADMVVANRQAPQRPEDRKFEQTVRLFLGSRFKDLRSGVRLMRKPVTEEIVLYGDQHNFMPLVAETHGFRVKELPLAARASQRRPVGIGRKPSLLLDVLAAYFLIRFVRRPFRFFGGIGLGVLAVGGAMTAYLVFARLFMGVGLLDRPALVLSTLMVVLGIQIISVGLIGEIITFVYTKEHRDYRVARIID
ncbi:MAG: glycosyltransferase [Geminicoccaceae bacterium]|nr:glycosyltransferase [Geminicoccaceae bacterium]